MCLPAALRLKVLEKFGSYICCIPPYCRGKVWTSMGKRCLGWVRLTGRVKGAVHHFVLSPPKLTRLLAPHLSEMACAYQATRKPLWWGLVSLSFSFHSENPPQVL